VNFTEVGTAAKQKRFLNALRYLANELRISIVCLGTEEMMRVIRSVSSVENRFPPMVLPQWQAGPEFRKLVASFEKVIPLKFPSDLHDSSILTAKLLTRSEGTIGELKMLLAAAARRDARRNGAYHQRHYRSVQLYVPPSPVPMNPTSQSCLISANNSMTFMKVSRLAGNTNESRRFDSGFCTVVNFVSCRVLGPTSPVPCRGQQAFGRLTSSWVRRRIEDIVAVTG